MQPAKVVPQTTTRCDCNHDKCLECREWRLRDKLQHALDGHTSASMELASAVRKKERMGRHVAETHDEARQTGKVPKVTAEHTIADPLAITNPAILRPPKV